MKNDDKKTPPKQRKPYEKPRVISDDEFEIAEAVFGIASISISPVVEGVDANGLVVVGQGAFKVAKTIFGKTSAVVGPGIFGS